MLSPINKLSIAFASVAVCSLALDLARDNSTALLPTFDDYLGSIGIDPASVKEEPAFPTYINDTTDWSPLRFMYSFVGKSLDNPYSYLIADFHKGTCTITLQGDPFDSKAVSINDRDAHLVTLFHEYRHCQPINLAMPYPLKEADADHYAITMAAHFNASATAPDAVLHMRAQYDYGFDHETALYLDAWLNNTPEPAHDDVMRAARQFIKMTDKAAMANLRDEASCYPHDNSLLRIVARLRAGNDERLIAETHHRIALYLDARRREDPALYARAEALFEKMKTPCFG